MTLLFVVTFITVLIAGMQLTWDLKWMTKKRRNKKE